MNEKLIKKICEMYNKWQHEYEMEYREECNEVRVYLLDYYSAPDLARGIKDHKVRVVEFFHDSDMELHGFLINCKYGFFEALVNMKTILNPSEYLNKSIYLADRLRAEFANALDKDAWMDEII